MKQFLFILSSLFSLASFSQCIAPFQDISNFVYIFDGGQEKYLENLPIQSYKVGRMGIFAYVAQNTHTKVYYKGKTVNISDYPVNYYMTDNWMVYQNFTTIKVLYRNEFITLENSFYSDQDSLLVNDSLVVWQNALGELNVFYDGKTQLLDRVAIKRPRLGPNLFAYVDANGYFKVFYHGQLQTLETYEPSSFVVNQDVLMYIDQYGNYKFFQDGDLQETNIPNTNSDYRVGKDFAVYMSNLKEFTIRYKGEDKVLLEDKPVRYTVRKNILVWTDKGNNFYCWYNGKTYWLERYIPTSYKIENDIVVYQDLDGRLKAFYYGDQVDVSDQIVTTGYNLFNEAVTYSIQPFETKVWCNKQTYTFK